MIKYIITVGRVERVYTDVKQAIAAFEFIRRRVDGELINCVKGQIQLYLEYDTPEGPVTLSLTREVIK